MQTEKVIAHIVAWLKSYVTDNQCNGFVIGVSGGIDSAVTSTLCAKTGLELLCLEMPIHQAKHQVARAAGHIRWLTENFPNATGQRVDLTAVFDRFVSALPQAEDDEERGRALANARARLRMTTLYHFAALKHCLVVGTGNKVEDFGIGFFTKHGDGGVDLSPIADLLKTEVYEAGRVLGVHPAIIAAAPTDGLWGDDRTDEEQIGASYPELEWAMKMDDEGKSAGDFCQREQEVFGIYKKYNHRNRHKMISAAVCKIPESLKKPFGS